MSDAHAAPLVDPKVVEEYTRAGWWGTRTLGDRVAELARERPDADAFVTVDTRTSWSEYDRAADEVARALVSAGVQPGQTVAVLMPDGAAVHAALVGCERAGAVAVGIGARAGDAEIAHLVSRTRSTTLVTLDEHRGRAADLLLSDLAPYGVSLTRHVVIDPVGPTVDVRAVDGARASSLAPASPVDLGGRSIGPNDLFLLNSTSGTTGLPKCVTQFQNRWFHFSDLAIAAGPLGPDDVFFGAVPAPFGFGLWTSHFAPAVLGAPTVVAPRFDADEMIRLIERERVTVLCCVSTQFRMLLNSPLCDTADLSSLRVMFTGGEAIPYDRAVEFEERTGAVVLQFFGSNETGAFSYTTSADPREKRLRTAGRLIEHMRVRLFDDAGGDVTRAGVPGQPGGRGPLTCAGYYDDPAADEQLYTPDGWMLMGDLVTVDDDGYLTLVGRTSDLIIRGGKNISAPQVEAQVETHPAVDLVAVVPTADELFGERVCAVVTLRPGHELSVAELSAYLTTRGVSKELHPERLLVVDELPRASGGKIAKAEVRALVDRSTVVTGAP